MNELGQTLHRIFASTDFYYAIGVLVSAILSYFITKKYIIKGINRFASFGNKEWRDIYIKNNTFSQVSYLVPAIILFLGVQYFSTITPYATRIINTYFVINFTLLLTKIISSGTDIYNLSPISKSRPIKGYLQLFNLFINIIGFISAICILLDKEVVVLLSGLGALTAVLLLVFRETILSFIASMQIISNNLIQKGDWIEVTPFGADGTVIDVALHVIKVQNFDKTVVTIPTYKIIESGFRNWRTMYTSGGRRIKRSILIDTASIRRLTHEEILMIRNNDFLKEHFIYDDGKTLKNNLTLFREYLEHYLKGHQELNMNMLFLVRHLEPTPSGLPLQIYTYTKDTRWPIHERVQAEIFEHIYAVLPLFHLRAFQNPTGFDFYTPSEKEDYLKIA
jgi:miniconductance mechanosensitive channel